MKYLSLLLIGGMLLSSCASIFNKKTTTVMVYTSEPTTIVHGDESFHSHKNRVKLKVPRADKDLELTVFQDEFEQKLYIGSHYSPAFYYNIPTNYGIGMLADLSNEKAYTYPKSVYLKQRNNGISYHFHGRGNHQGEWNLHLSIPYINHFQFRPGGSLGEKRNTGFWSKTGTFLLPFTAHLSDDQRHRDHRFVPPNSGTSGTGSSLA